MVRSINEIGHLTGKQTIAEFAENQEIINMLQSLGVDYAQGLRRMLQPQRVLKAANSAWTPAYSGTQATRTVDFSPMAAISSVSSFLWLPLVSNLTPWAVRKICAKSPRMAKLTRSAGRRRCPRRTPPWTRQ